MLKAEVLKFFGGPKNTAEALGISPASVSQWGETIPLLRAYQVEQITNGALKREPDPNKAA
ncbi:Cro/CI family transcriptional regulator [Photobacterium ganghwense]|uniref:Cro/CI family transcriptional regulator n=1 Tax=Photobacterium ganghwense TaxID=320778 RepID=UPI001C2DEA98|nr:Cro/CI family transcriptional regulator [Photobacterium ganghwense]MBV1842220.1 Cro/Cl family transcriptional regulator [Photobacterium ganghwense]